MCIADGTMLLPELEGVVSGFVTGTVKLGLKLNHWNQCVQTLSMSATLSASALELVFKENSTVEPGKQLERRAETDEEKPIRLARRRETEQEDQSLPLRRG